MNSSGNVDKDLDSRDAEEGNKLGVEGIDDVGYREASG